jgi:hypothetical protein
VLLLIDRSISMSATVSDADGQRRSERAIERAHGLVRAVGGSSVSPSPRWMID